MVWFNWWLFNYQKYSSESPSSMIVCDDSKFFLDHLPPPIPIPFPSVLVGDCIIVGDKLGDVNDLGDKPEKPAASRFKSVRGSRLRSVSGSRFKFSCFIFREARYWDILRFAGFEGAVEGGLDEGESWKRDVRMVLVK
jgi:hypothetical protein